MRNFFYFLKSYFILFKIGLGLDLETCGYGDRIGSTGLMGIHWHEKVSDHLPYLPYKMAFSKRIEKYLKTAKFIVFSSIPMYLK